MAEHGERKPGSGSLQPREVAVHGYFIPVDAPRVEERVGLREAWARIRRHWKLLAACMAVAALIGLVWSLTAAPMYRSAALVKVVEENDRLGGLASLTSQLGGLASLAGLRLPGGSNRAEAVAVLQSKSLAEQFIRDHSLMPLLFEKRWDAGAKKWRGKRAPSMAQAIEEFSEDVRFIQEDKLTGLVRVVVRWRDPEIAAAWSNDLVRLANERMRQRAVDEARRSLQYLEREMAKTRNIELQQAISRLMQEQLNSATLASVRTEYALQTIDAARAPDRDDYVWPRPIILVLLGLGVGALLGSGIALFIERRRNPACGPPARA